MNKELNVRFYQPGDETEIAELMKTAFPFWVQLPNPVDYFKWRYLDSYEKSYVVIVTSGDKIICINLQTTQKIKIMDTVYKSTFGAETTTHPDYRGLGAWNKTLDLYEKCRKNDEIQFHYSNTQNPIVIQKSLNQERYVFPHQMTEMMRIKSADQIKSAFKRTGFVTLKTLNKINNILSEDKDVEADFDIIDIKKFGTDINSFIGKVKSHYNYLIVKNQEFLNWRYCDPRGGAYIIKQAVKDGTILGYIVLESIKVNNENGGNIAEILALPDRADVAKSLIRTACNYFDEHNYNSIKLGVAKQHPYQSISTRLGFLDTSMITKMLTFGVFTPLGDVYDKLSASPAEKISYNLGDVFLH